MSVFIMLSLKAMEQLEDMGDKLDKTDHNSTFIVTTKIERNYYSGIWQAQIRVRYNIADKIIKVKEVTKEEVQRYKSR